MTINKIQSNPTDRHDLIEKLSDYAHEAWINWVNYLFSKSVKNKDGSVTIPKDLVKRWERQCGETYYISPDHEQESDRKEAKKILNVVLAHFTNWGKYEQ